MANYSMTKEARIYDGEKTVFSISGIDKIGQLATCKRMKLEHFLKPYTKKLKIYKDLNVRLEAIKLLYENMYSILSDLDLSSIYLSIYLSVIYTYTHTYTHTHIYIGLKNFCTAKETINKTKRQPTEWEKIFVNNMSDKG